MKKNLAGNEKGFTLIELIVVIVILGILAAVAVPKYTDMKIDAQKAAANGVFGGAQGATAVNFAGNILGKNLPKITTGTTLVGALDGGTPNGWKILDATCAAAGGGTIGCIYMDLDNDDTLDATEYVVGISSIETTTARAVLQKGTAAY